MVAKKRAIRRGRAPATQAEATLTRAIESLQSRKAALEADLAVVRSRIETIAKILQVAPGAYSQVAVAERAAAPVSGHAAAPARKGAKQYRWFEAGEAVTLMKRLVRKPVPAADVVRLLTAAKGHGKLPPAQLKRFHATAYMAVTNAVKSGAAKRLKDGRIQIA